MFFPLYIMRGAGDMMREGRGVGGGITLRNAR